jgi:putative autotransporter adhesin-like protein
MGSQVSMVELNQTHNYLCARITTSAYLHAMKQSRSKATAAAVFFTVALMYTLFLIPSCDNGNGCTDGSGGTVTVELDLAPFHSIIAGSEVQIEIEQGTEQLVEVDGQQNIIDDITTQVSDGIWLIELTGNCYNNLDIVIRITLPTIKSIESTGTDRVILNSFDSLDQLTVLVSGAGLFFQSGVLNVSDKLTLQSTGAGEMTANFNTQSLEVLISGSANMNLSGSTTSHTGSLSGSGNCFAFDLSSKSCTINSSESGNTEVFVEDELDVTMSGSGNVSYKGSPTIISTITGTGELINAN